MSLSVRYRRKYRTKSIKIRSPPGFSSFSSSSLCYFFFPLLPFLPSSFLFCITRDWTQGLHIELHLQAFCTLHTFQRSLSAAPSLLQEARQPMHPAKVHTWTYPTGRQPAIVQFSRAGLLSSPSPTTLPPHLESSLQHRATREDILPRPDQSHPSTQLYLTMPRVKISVSNCSPRDLSIIQCNQNRNCKYSFKIKCAFI